MRWCELVCSICSQEKGLEVHTKFLFRSVYSCCMKAFKSQLCYGWAKTELSDIQVLSEFVCDQCSPVPDFRAPLKLMLASCL